MANLEKNQKIRQLKEQITLEDKRFHRAMKAGRNFYELKEIRQRIKALQKRMEILLLMH
jgi:hypothetical protein